jgi:hypothetical protein
MEQKLVSGAFHPCRTASASIRIACTRTNISFYHQPHTDTTHHLSSLRSHLGQPGQQRPTAMLLQHATTPIGRIMGHSTQSRRAVLARASSSEDSGPQAPAPQSIKPAARPAGRPMPPRGPQMMLGPDGQPIKVWRAARCARLVPPSSRKAAGARARSLACAAADVDAAPSAKLRHQTNPCNRSSPSSAPATRRGRAWPPLTAGKATSGPSTGGEFSEAGDCMSTLSRPLLEPSRSHPALLPPMPPPKARRAAGRRRRGRAAAVCRHRARQPRRGARRRRGHRAAVPRR